MLCRRGRGAQRAAFGVPSTAYALQRFDRLAQKGNCRACTLYCLGVAFFCWYMPSIIFLHSSCDFGQETFHTSKRRQRGSARQDMSMSVRDSRKWLRAQAIHLQPYLCCFLMAMRLSSPLGSSSPVFTEKMRVKIEKRRTCEANSPHINNSPAEGCRDCCQNASQIAQHGASTTLID